MTIVKKVYLALLIITAALVYGGNNYIIHAATMTLVAHEIKPTIIISPTATESEKFASRELATYLGKISGQKVNIAATAQRLQASRKNPLIVIGHHPLNASLHPENLGVEESIIDIHPGCVRIVGGKLPPLKNARGQLLVRDRGTLYGVYNFLDQLGVRWYRPESWGEYVPHHQSIHLTVGKSTFKPVYKIRMGINSYRWPPDQSAEQYTQAILWATRNRFNTSMWTGPKYGGYYQVDFAHSYFQLMPHDEYYKTHPEYYALIDGKRSSDPRAQLCLGNPQVQKIIAGKIIRDAKENPQKIWFSLEPNDNKLWCQCPLCRAMDDPHLRTAEGKISMSNRVCAFNNIIARKLEQAVPGRKIAWLAYSYSLHSEIPSLVKTLEPNTIVGATTYGENYSDYNHNLLDPQSPQNQRFVKVLSGYGKLTELFTYEYWSGYRWYGPLPVLNVMKDRLRIYHQRFNVKGVYNEFHQSWGPQGINHYFYARLMWDPAIHVEKELRLYCRNYYGPAANTMLRYHHLLLDAAHNGPYFGSGGLHIENLYTPQLLSQMKVLLEKARTEIGSRQPYLKRFEGVAAGYQVARMTREIVDLKDQHRPQEAIKAINALEEYILADTKGEVFDNGKGIFPFIFRTPLQWKKELASQTS